METVTTPQAARILGMSFRTLDNWVRAGLVTCSQVARGRGTRRAWTVDDVTRVALLQTLRRHGVSTQQLNAMKQRGNLDYLQDSLLEGPKTYGDGFLFTDLVLILGDEALQITIRPKRKAVEKAFDALEAGLLPEPLTYNDAPSGIQGWVNGQALKPG
jgi:DNA-binding transcriptional MerR regulator